jgi:hypothetical protein
MVLEWFSAWGQVKSAYQTIVGIAEGNPSAVAAGILSAGTRGVGGQVIGRGSSVARGAVEMHHLLPQAARFRQFFERAGLDIEEFKIPLDRATHRLNPGGVHTRRGGDWNGVWDDFFRVNPNATQQEILSQMARMRQDFGI